MAERWFIMKMQSYPASCRTVLEGTHFANKLVAVFQTPEAAQAVVDLHNAILDKEAAIAAEPVVGGSPSADPSHLRRAGRPASLSAPHRNMVLSHLIPEGEVRRIRALERTIGELREHIRQLDELLAPQVDLPASWHLTPAQTQVFRALLARDMVTKQHAMHAASAVTKDVCSDNYVKFHVFGLRSKLVRYGVEIETVWGCGYRLMNRLSWRAKLGCKNAGPGISPPEPAP